MINILPQEEKKILKYEYWMRFFSVIFIMITVLGVVASALLLPSYVVSRSKELSVDKELQEFNSLNVEINPSDLNKSINEINSRLEILGNSTPKKHITDSLFSILSLRPQGVTFYQILCNKRSDGFYVFQINGKATDRSALRDFENTLHKNKDVSDINLPIGNFIKKTNLEFNLSFYIK